MKKVPGKVPNKGEALRPQHFAQSYNVRWLTGLAISKVIPSSSLQSSRFSDVRGQSLRESMLP